MEKIKGNSKIDYAHLERSLSQLISALGEHTEHLDSHAAVMENLAQDIRQLRMVLAKEDHLKLRQPSLQLKQAVSLLVDYYINPQYYRRHREVKLIGGSIAKHTGSPHHKESF